MSVNDPIADMLTRIRNAVSTGQPQVAMPSSTVKAEMARILREEGFIEAYEVVDGEKAFERSLRLKLKYVGERRERRPVITGLVRVSRPGRSHALANCPYPQGRAVPAGGNAAASGRRATSD